MKFKIIESRRKRTADFLEGDNFGEIIGKLSSSCKIRENALQIYFETDSDRNQRISVFHRYKRLFLLKRVDEIN